MTSQKFEAAGVALPGDAQEELVVAESIREPVTITRQIDAVDGEVTITNQIATYARGPARGHPTLMEAFTGTVNGTDGAGSAMLLNSGDAFAPDGDDWEGLPVPPSLIDQASVVVPAGARSDDGVLPSETMVIGSSESPTDDQLQAMQMPAYVLDVADVFPHKYWLHVDNPYGLHVDNPYGLHVDNPYGAEKRWLHDDAPFVLNEDSTVVVPLGDRTPEEVFGKTAEEMPGELIEDQQALDDGTPLITLFPVPKSFDTGNNPFLENINSLFTGNNPFLLDAKPAPLSGATFQIGVLSTPAAEIAGTSVNPLAGMALSDILTSEQLRSLGQEAVGGVGEGGWLDGPTPISDVPDGAEVTILDTDAEFESFTGVVDGEHGPWAVGIHMARVEHDDEIVITAATHRWPVASAEEVPQSGEGKRFTAILGTIFVEARALTAGVTERLVPIPDLA